MGKISIIIQREFNERVRKKTFIITTILTPLLFIGIMFAPMMLAHYRSSGTKQIIVTDASGVVAGNLESDEFIAYKPSDKTLEEIKADHRDGGTDDVFGILTIGADVVENPRNVRFYTYQSSTLEIESSISRQVAAIIEGEKLKAYDIENLPQILDEVNTTVVLQAFRIDESGESKESSSTLSMMMAFIFGFLIYMFIFLYGGMVMQGVIEEKSSKVLEIIVSSVKPFELMMGKIIGIAAVAITQFLIWIVLIFALSSLFMNFFAADMLEAAGAMADGGMTMGMDGFDPDSVAAIRNLTDMSFLLRIFGGFFVFFIGGYLLYAAIFAAIGSAVDNVADSQQLQLPVTIPMILAILVMMNVMNDPHGSLAFWFSMIPLTSPIIMVARLPYGVPAWEFALSLGLLYASFIAMVWLAGKIYRVGIFMYGKKPTFGELFKWARYKY